MKLYLMISWFSNLEHNFIKNVNLYIFTYMYIYKSPVVYWAHTDLGSSSFSILKFCLFILFMGFWRQEYWSGLPFSSPVDHVLSDLSTMTCPSWVDPRPWLSFIELDKAVVLMWLDWLVFCDYGFSVSALWCPLATPTVLLGFLLPWTWVSLHGCSSKAQPLLLNLDNGIFSRRPQMTLKVE